MKTLSNIYYNPKLGLRGIKALYDKAKELGLRVTMKEVKDFLKKQEVHQVYSIRKYKDLPLFASSPFERMQLDLLDVSNEIPRMNNGVKFLMCMIDVFTRYGFVVPMKSKSEKEVLDSFAKIIGNIKSEFGVVPSVIDSDNESSFMSRSFTRFCHELNINQNFSEVGDYKSKGVVEAWNKTLRRLIAKYRTAYKSNRYIVVLDDLVEGYNNSYHSFLRASPVDAVKSPVYFMQAYSEKFEKNLPDEKVSIGDKVRLRIKRKNFDKGSSMANWTNSVHTVEDIEGVKYKVSGRVGLYKRDEMLKIYGNVEENPDIQSSFLRQLQNRPIQNTEENIRRYRASQTARRRLNREGI